MRNFCKGGPQFFILPRAHFSLCAGLTEGTQHARQTNDIIMEENNNMSNHLEDHSYSAIPLKSVDQSPDVAENDSSDSDSWHSIGLHFR